MTILQHAVRTTLLGLAGTAVTVGLFSGCSSDNSTTEPSSSVTSTTSAIPTTTAIPTTSVPSAAGSASVEPTAPQTGNPTGAQSGGPSQTVSGGPSASPPSVQRSPSPPTGDNLPGENNGPNSSPGTPGDDN